MFLINPYILQASGNPLWNDLLAYYTADNTPNDALGNYNGTLVNGTTYGTGIINQGFSFDGVNDYIDLGNNFSFDVNNAFSFSFWVDRVSGSNFSTLFSKVDSTTLQGYHIRFDNNINGKIQLTLLDSLSNLSEYITTNQLVDLNIHMITVTYDGLNTATSCKIYVDGVMQSLTRNITGAGATSIINTESAKIGVNSYTGGVHFFNGIIDEVGIWNRELTASEVTELYNSGAGKQYT
jgi:hypothetical protein